MLEGVGGGNQYVQTDLIWRRGRDNREVSGGWGEVEDVRCKLERDKKVQREKEEETEGRDCQGGERWMEGEKGNKLEPAEQMIAASSAQRYDPSRLRNVFTVQKVIEPERHRLFIASKLVQKQRSCCI